MQFHLIQLFDPLISPSANVAQAAVKQMGSRIVQGSNDHLRGEHLIPKRLIHGCGDFLLRGTEGRGAGLDIIHDTIAALAEFLYQCIRERSTWQMKSLLLIWVDILGVALIQKLNMLSLLEKR